MIWKNALKYPVLVIGIVWMAIYLSDAKTADFWNKMKYRFHPATYACGAILERIEDKLDDNWSLHCNKPKYLIVRINDMDSNSYKGLNKQAQRAKLYRNLFNDIVKFGTVANPDTVAQIETLKINYQAEPFSVVVSTDGQAIVQIRNAIYKVNRDRLKFRADKRLESIKDKPSDKEELDELWNQILTEERDKMVRNNIKLLLLDMSKKDGRYSTLLQVREYTDSTNL